MKDLAILVDNKNDSTEAQDLLFSMGYKWRGLGEISKSYFYPKMNKYFIFMNKNEMDLQMAGYFAGSSRSYTESRFKEITLPQLRDLVVLKRNDRKDANVLEDNCLYDLYLTKSRELYFYHCGKNKWILSNLNGDDFYYELLKPIEKKEMKEYLIKSGDGKYLLTHHDSIGAIEIPEGSETLNYYDRKDNLFFLKGTGENALFSNDLNDWEWKEWGDIDFDGVVCLWSRHTLPEELPFIDDECYTNKSDGVFRLPISEPCDISNWVEIREEGSLNDQYAEIETVRQSAWQKQEGGSHYKNLKIQPMQYALENKLDYAQANVVKYVTRHKEKNGKEDLLKAIHNIELMIEFYYGGGE